jgi:hypothetical protein
LLSGFAPVVLRQLLLLTQSIHGSRVVTKMYGMMRIVLAVSCVLFCCSSSPAAAALEHGVAGKAAVVL